MSRYQRALTFATLFHSGQKRRGGEPYIIHPIRVSQGVSGETEKVVALLHDVVEDTSCSFKDVYDYFGPEVVRAVHALTRRPHESYKSFMYRIKDNDIATRVKVADIADNLNDDPTPHAIEKYAKGLDILITHE